MSQAKAALHATAYILAGMAFAVLCVAILPVAAVAIIAGGLVYRDE